jgi:hypothetical protein
MDLPRHVLPERKMSVLQDWVMSLPLRAQGTLLTCVRGCDLAPKQWGVGGENLDYDMVHPQMERQLVAYLRWTFLNPEDPREVNSQEGSWFRSSPPDLFKPSAFGHFPLHWYSHVMHSLRVISAYHPWPEVRRDTLRLYEAMVHSLHLNPETPEQLGARLTEDRIAAGTVVS